MNVFTQKEFADNLWNITGSFGQFSESVSESGNAFLAENGKISVKTEIQKSNGVFERYGTVKNVSGEKVTLNTLSSKFILDGGEYEVYSQYNGWQNESIGGWQPLVTSVYARSESVRNAHSAAPFMVLWSNQAGRGVAFHISAYSAWEMRISRVYAGGEASFVEVELGVMKDGLSINLEPDEEFELPEIIYYDVFNKTDLDCWKLHGYLNEKYPRKAMPVMYNTWLYKFDRFTYEDILGQIKKAQELGVEYFVIDAGWFGKGENWWSLRGDWEENQTFGFKGRTVEIAEEVKNHGMKFGFWLEPECAAEDSEIIKKHPEYFIKGPNSYFIDFANPDALSYIFGKTCELVDRFGAEFMKFDFNADLKFDNYGSGFTKYCRGHMQYIKMLKEKYPDLYIENCASGGMRMAVRDGMLYDSFWLTDNQSPYHSMRIFKDTLLRMPPQWIECWASITSVKSFSPVYGSYDYADKIIACNDATWNDVAGIHQSFLEGFLTGSPIGLSFDLNSLTEKMFDDLKAFIAKFKANRDFWKTAVCHVLTDTETMLVLEFRNKDFSKVELVVFTKNAIQNNICVYPVLNDSFDYEVGENTKSGKDIFEDGIDFAVNECQTAQFLALKKR